MTIRKVYLCLGGNQGDSQKVFSDAKLQLEKKIGRCVQCSSLYKTLPLTASGVASSTVSRYTNAAVAFESDLEPNEILKACLDVETALGRIRDIDDRYASRVIDIDIAIIEDVVIRGTAELSSKFSLDIPHPRLHERDFMMIPLIEINPTLIHPTMGIPLSELVAATAVVFVESSTPWALEVVPKI